MPPSRSVGTYTFYNALGQVASIMDAASNVTAFAHDSLGRRIEVIDALSNSTHTAYDLENRVLATWGATYPVAYDYDDFGRMSAMYTLRDSSLVISNYSSFITHASSFDQTRWLYDQATGLLTNKLYSDNVGPRYTYTSDGKLATRTWARGVVTTYNYDSLNQLTNINYTDSTPAVGFTYDRLGRQVTITDGQGSRLFSYTDAFQLAVETNSAAELVRVYDSQGRPSGYDLVMAGSTSVVSSIRYTHNEAGRFHQVDADLRATPLPLRNFRYGYLAGADLVESLTETNSGINMARSYEQRRNLITQILNTSGTNLISRFDYENDAIGRRTRRVDASALTNDFGYNVRSELIEAVMGTNHFSYCYDPIGNRRTATNNSAVSEYLANSLNQYSQITNNGALITPQYDLDGNMTAYGEWRFAWDAENRMTGASNAITVARYSYDFMSRRVRKIVNGVTNNFVYDGWNLISEITVGGAQSITNRYLWGLDLSGTQQGAGGIGGLLSVARNGVTYYPCYDANGNITDYVDQNGVVAAHQEYDAYGNTVVSSGLMVNDFNFWFSSKYLDRETGLYSFGLRYYAPEFGRFLSCDPARESTIGNQYGYLFNNSFYGIEFLGLLRVVFYDDDFTTEADALYLYWSATDPYERSIKVRVESVSAFQTGVAIINHYARLSGENVNKLVLMFHGFPEFITIGEGSALEFLSANGETATPLGNPATPISSLPDIPFGESAVIQLNTCRGGFPVGGGLKNVGQAFNDRYGVSTVAFPYWIKYAGEDSFVVIPTLSSLFIFPRLEFVTYPPKETPCKRKCPLLLLQ